MKTLVKVLKIEDDTVYYAEISKDDGSVMIDDSQSIESFNKALNMEEFGFKLVEVKTKQQAVALIEKFGLVVEDWSFCSVFGYSASVKLPYTYDNGYGIQVDSVTVKSRYSRASLVELAIDCLTQGEGFNL